MSSANSLRDTKAFSLIFKWILTIYHFRICRYATTHTEDSVYIIGGFTGESPVSPSRIAKYKNDNWAIAGNLKQARMNHGAITVKGRTLIIGGVPINGTT